MPSVKMILPPQLFAVRISGALRRKTALHAPSVFSDAVQFLDTFRAGMFDLIFMDIQLSVLNGVEAARRLRKTDPSVSLVFVTDLKNRVSSF